MNEMRTKDTYKITVKMRRRADGGLRVWSDQLPGLVLSHRDPERVLSDIEPALETILEGILGCPVKAERLSALPIFGPQQSLADRARDAVDTHMRTVVDFFDRHFGHVFGRIEFVARACA